MSNKTSIVLSILPLVFLTLIVFHFSTDLPYWDQWEFVPLLEKSYQGTLSFNDFWVPHNEHRPVFPRLIMLGLARLTNWNIRYELAVNILLAIGIYTVIMKSIILLAGDATSRRSSRGEAMLFEHAHGLESRFDRDEFGKCRKIVWPTLASAAVYTSALIIFSLTQWENWVWGWQIQVFLNVFAVCLGFYFLIRSTHSTHSVNSVQASSGQSKINFIASIICGIVATFSFANGLLFWPIGFFILINPSSLARSHLARLIWLMVSIVIYAIYLPGIPTQFDFFSITNNILLYLSYVTAYLGAPVFGLQPLVASLFGILGLLIFIYGFISSFRSRFNRERNLAKRSFNLKFFHSLGLYAILSAFFTGMGRYNLGGLQAISSRYITFGNLLWLSNIVFLYDISNSCISELNHWYKLFTRVSKFTIFIIIFLIVITSLYRIKTIAKRYNDLTSYPRDFKKLYYNEEVIKERMKFLHEKFNKFLVF